MVVWIIHGSTEDVEGAAGEYNASGGTLIVLRGGRATNAVRKVAAVRAGLTPVVVYWNGERGNKEVPEDEDEYFGGKRKQWRCRRVGGNSDRGQRSRKEMRRLS